MNQRSDLSFIQSDAVTVAQQLIGWRFYVREQDGNLTGGVITETEAYTQDDAASHSFNGRTSRNDVMFGPAGHLYVYFTYGMHWCANIVTGSQGVGEAVLIRALEIDQGIQTIRERRNNQPDSILTNGPAKICQALTITGADNGIKLNESRCLLLPPKGSDISVVGSMRIGISKDAHRLWRFTLQ